MNTASLPPDPFEQGYQDYLKEPRVYLNPYTAGTCSHEDYIEGRLQAVDEVYMPLIRRPVS